jgi:hypothetical protein
MIYGPLNSQQNLSNSNFFLTDVIKGESVVFYLHCPIEKIQDAKLSISRVVHGYRNMFSSILMSGSIKAAGSCEKDIACYPDWNNESDGVARILLSNGSSVCTGSLLNNTAQNFRGFILTAFHCVDYDENGTISSGEQSAAATWAFTFHYKLISCNGSQVASTVTYNNDNLLTSWYTSDVALLELTTPITNTCLSFLGWDRTGTVPSSTTGIHHPQGDVMKISFDNGQPILTDRLQDNSGSYFWKVNWDIGVTERYSSGSPLFDQNKRIVGQLLGGYSSCGGSDLRDWYGAFKASYSAVLSPFLGNSNYVNTIRYGQITGSDPVCGSNTTFTLQNPPAGSTITWSASNVTPSSGTGPTATVHSNCVMGAESNITFTITNSCMSVGQVSFSKSYLSAGPKPSDVTLDVYKSTGQHARKAGGIFLLCPNSTYYLYVNNNSTTCSTSQYSWTLPPSLTRNYANNNMISVNTNANPGGNVLVYARTCCSDCGSNVRILSDYVGRETSCGYSYMIFTPNPTANEAVLELKTDYPEDLSTQEEWSFELYNQQSTLISKINKMMSNKYAINTSSLKEGIYYVRVIFNDRVLFGKFAVAR